MVLQRRLRRIGNKNSKSQFFQSKLSLALSLQGPLSLTAMNNANSAFYPSDDSQLLLGQQQPSSYYQLPFGFLKGFENAPIYLYPKGLWNSGTVQCLDPSDEKHQSTDLKVQVYLSDVELVSEEGSQPELKLPVRISVQFNDHLGHQKCSEVAKDMSLSSQFITEKVKQHIIQEYLKQQQQQLQLAFPSPPLLHSLGQSQQQQPFQPRDKMISYPFGSTQPTSQQQFPAVPIQEPAGRFFYDNTEYQVEDPNGVVSNNDNNDAFSSSHVDRCNVNHQQVSLPLCLPLCLPVLFNPLCHHQPQSLSPFGPNPPKKEVTRFSSRVIVSLGIATALTASVAGVVATYAYKERSVHCITSVNTYILSFFQRT